MVRGLRNRSSRNSLPGISQHDEQRFRPFVVNPVSLLKSSGSSAVQSAVTPPPVATTPDPAAAANCRAMLPRYEHSALRRFAERTPSPGAEPTQPQPLPKTAPAKGATVQPAKHDIGAKSRLPECDISSGACVGNCRISWPTCALPGSGDLADGVMLGRLHGGALRRRSIGRGWGCVGLRTGWVFAPATAEALVLGIAEASARHS